MIRKVVITAAGLGTRLLTVTKEQPKEMLPLFARNNDGSLCVKPLLQIIFEQLHDCGFREFCFIIGRGKRVVEDHFTVDRQFIKQLFDKGKSDLAKSLEDFYCKLDDSVILWINQPEPKGFGHGVLMANHYVGDDPFLVHAGDAFIFSRTSHIKMMTKTYEENKPAATLLLKEIENPRQYGVALVHRISSEFFSVDRVVEKPQKPLTNMAIMPIYVFNPTIMKILETLRPGLGNEIQLTDGIQELINKGLSVEAIKLNDDDIRIDVGSPETYWEALTMSYKYSRT